MELRALNMQLFIIWTIVSVSSAISEASFTSQGACSPPQQRAILEAVMSCQTRDTLVDLRDYLPDATNVLHVIPDLATIKRCGGSCDVYSHRCVPTHTKKRRLEVMVVSSSSGSSLQTSTECGLVEVEEHEGCECGCRLQAHHCRADQYYEGSSCRCLCRSQESREQCLQKGMQWDGVRCMCICPVSSWQTCSTGYVFDFTRSCACVATSTTASTGLLAAAVILLTCFALTVGGAFFMYKRQVGLFRPDKATVLREQQRSNPNIDVNTFNRERDNSQQHRLLRPELQVVKESSEETAVTDELV